MPTIAVVNQKGGVGKTTTVANLGVALGRLGRRVLVVDLDPQAHLSLHLRPNEDEGPSIYDVLVEGRAIEDVLVPIEGEKVWLVPGSLDLSSAEIQLAGMRERESKLFQALREIRRFDVVLLDCPPSLGLLSLNALTAADELLVPMQSEFFSLHGVARLMEVVGALGKRGPSLMGVLLCRHQVRTNLSREVAGELKRHFGSKLLKTVIHQNVRLAEASSHGCSIFGYAPRSRGAEDYRALARELVRHWRRQRQKAAGL